MHALIIADLAATDTLYVMTRLSSPPPSIATWQLTPEYMQQFDATVTQTKGVQFSILGGTGIPLCVLSAAASTLGLPVPDSGDGSSASQAPCGTASRFGTSEPRSGSRTSFMTGSHPTFSTWVAPLLETGIVPGFAADQPRRATRTRIDRADASAAAKAKPTPERKAKVRCAQGSSTAATIAAGGVFTVARGTKVVPMPVGAAQKMTVTVLSGGSVVVRVVNGAGKVVDSGGVARGQSGLSFQSWTIDRPAAGAWKLSITDSVGSSQFAYFVTQTKPALLLNAHLSESAGGQILLSAQLTRDGRPLSDARLTGFLISAAGKRSRVTLTAEPRHRGLYRLTRVVRLTTPSTAGGIDAALVATGPGFSVSTMASDVVSCRAGGQALKPHAGDSPAVAHVTVPPGRAG